MDSNDEGPLDSRSLAKFLPELAIVPLTAIFGPIWSVVLALKGYVLAGVLFWIGAWFAGYLAYWSYKKGDQRGIFLAIGGVVLLVMGIAKWTKQF
jgi:hypothetical protein